MGPAIDTGSEPMTASTRRGGIFYGWWIVLAGASLVFVSAGTFVHGFGVFFNPLVAEFGWTRAATSFAFSLRSLESGFAAPVVGFLVDRLGPRRLIILGAIVAGLAFVMLSRMDSLIAFYVSFLILSAGHSGTSGVVAMSTVVPWFRKRRSQAMGLVMVGAGAGGLLVPVLSWLITDFGWRNAFLFCAAAMWLIVAPLGLVVRHRPEQYGLAPDGEPLAEAPETAGLEESLSPPRGGEGYSVRQALRTPAFWYLAIPLATVAAIHNAISIHLIPALIGVGFEPGEAALAMSLLAVASVVGRAGLGWLGDHTDKKVLLLGTFIMQIAGLAILSYNMDTWWLIAVFTAIYSTAQGGTVPLRGALQAEYFGLRAFASIQGLMMGVMTVGTIFSPPFAGWIYDITGSYHYAWLGLTVVMVVATPLLLLARPPAGTPAAIRYTIRGHSVVEK